MDRVSIDDLDLSKRAYKALQNADIHYLDEISEDWLLLESHCYAGVLTIAEIAAEAAKHGHIPAAKLVPPTNVVNSTEEIAALTQRIETLRSELRPLVERRRLLITAQKLQTDALIKAARNTRSRQQRQEQKLKRDTQNKRHIQALAIYRQEGNYKAVADHFGVSVTTARRLVGKAYSVPIEEHEATDSQPTPGAPAEANTSPSE